ncbi:MAG TPA: class I SAM-dependent methyltransferase [Bryobacteraceae bacterium]|nr:class I SAM-dependent methyltransferase [Bryobacteraceae bacterium]
MSECPMCGSQRGSLLFRQTDRLYRTTDQQFGVVRCAQCRLIRLHPQPSPEELRRYYPPNYWFAPDRSLVTRLEELYRRIVLRGHVRFVARALRESLVRGPLLDVGCGGGLFLAMMRRRGFPVVGLDSSHDAAAAAWRHHRVTALVADLEHAPFRPGSFAGITMSHVLEHLADPCVYLAAAHRLLVPNGRLIIFVPNASSLQFAIFGRRWNGLDVPRHLFDYRDRDVENILDMMRFAVVRRSYFSLRDNPAGFATSLAPGLDPMARRVRKVPEGPAGRLAKDLAHFALVAAALPFTWVEAAMGAGSTVIVEARRI